MENPGSEESGRGVEVGIYIGRVKLGRDTMFEADLAFTAAKKNEPQLKKGASD